MQVDVSGGAVALLPGPCIVLGVIMFRQKLGRLLAQVFQSINQGVRSSERFQHSFSIDFDVSRPLPEGAIEILGDVSRTLATHGIQAIVAEGTLLGLVRDQRIIPHDTDLDLYILNPDVAEMATEILQADGWQIGQHVRIGLVSSHITFYNDKQVLLDLTFFEQIGDRFYSFKERDGYLVIDVDIMTKPINTPGLDHLLMPAKPTAFLEAYFGRDWRTPKTKKTFWKDEYCGIFVRGVQDIVESRNKILRQTAKFRN